MNAFEAFKIVDVFFCAVIFFQERRKCHFDKRGRFRFAYFKHVRGNYRNANIL